MKNILGNIYRSLHMPKNLQLFIMRLLHDKFLVGVTGIILNEKNEILIFKHTYRSHPWSLPGGYLTAGEHPKEALEREIKEESGLTICIDEALKIRTDRETARLDLCYVGTYIGGEFTPSKEVSEYGFFSMDNLPLLRKNQLFLIDEVIKDRIYK